MDLSLEGLEMNFRDHFGVWRGLGAHKNNPEAPRRHPGVKNTDFKDGWLEEGVYVGAVVVLVSVILFWFLMSMFVMHVANC